MIKRLFTLTFAVISIFLNGQNGVTCDPGWFIKPSYNYGFILEHRSTIGHLVKGYPSIYEINIGKPTCGHSIWHFENNKPDLGISLSFIDYKNPQQLGYSYAIAPYAEIPLNKIERSSRVVMRLCWGIAYLNKRFDVQENSKNIAIGSHVNSFVQFKWFWHLQINNKLRFEPGFAFTHESNARAKVPNLGLNIVSLNAAFNYLIVPKKAVCERPDTTPVIRSKNELLVYSAFGFNQREVATDELYCGLLSAEFHRNVRNTHKFGFGFDVYADQNYIKDYIVEYKKSPEGLDNFRIAAKICYSYNVGRISFPIDIGYYVFQKTKPDGLIVSRIGIKYYSKSGITASIGLRTHFAVAYNFEYGLGYRFFLGKNK